MKSALCIFASLLFIASAGIANGATVPSDNVGVTRVEFLVNGGLQCSDTTAPYSCNWSVPNARTTFQLQARAFDQAGNVGTASIQVTAR